MKHMRRGLFILAAFVTGGAALLNGASGPGGSGSGGGGGGSSQQVTLTIPSEMAPPGGMVQMKFLVTQPTPISSGKPKTSITTSSLTTVSGIALFNQSGDLNGVAMVNGAQVSVSYITSTGPQGTDYPIMTISMPVPANAPVGSQTSFNLDPSSTWVLSTGQTATVKPQAPATITVAGSISITNVVPGGGVLPAGTVVSVQGVGFQPKTQIQLNAINASAVTVVNPNLIQFVLAKSTNMTGQKIQVTNPDGSQDTYFSYLRGVPLFPSSQPLLASAVPIFSAMSYSQATFAPIAPAASTQFTGLAFQNANLAAANVTVSLYSAASALLASATYAVPGGYRVMGETSELAQGVAPPLGSYAVVSSTAPIAVFGFVGDNSAGTVTPFTAIATQP